MLTKNQIEDLIRKWINDQEELGQKPGGSGHLSSKDYELETIHEPVKTITGWRASFDYTVYLTTEFTIYPDNPPYEYPKKGILEWDNEGNLLTQQEEGEW